MLYSCITGYKIPTDAVASLTLNFWISRVLPWQHADCGVGRYLVFTWASLLEWATVLSNTSIHYWIPRTNNVKFELCFRARVRCKWTKSASTSCHSCTSEINMVAETVGLIARGEKPFYSLQSTVIKTYKYIAFRWKINVGPSYVELLNR
jgi:hypothetical protein